MNKRVKVLCDIQSDNPGEAEVESLWAIACDEGYQLDNIPFYAKGVALNDLVDAKEVGGCIRVTKLLQPSGHSTVQIWFTHLESIESTRDQLKKNGCNSEISDKPRLVAVDVPPSVKYSEIKRFLDEGVTEKKWDYQEACLGYI